MICQPRRRNSPSDPRARSPGRPGAGPPSRRLGRSRRLEPPAPRPGPRRPFSASPISHLLRLGRARPHAPGLPIAPSPPLGTVPAPPALTLPLPPSPALPPPAPRPRPGAARRAGHTRCGGLAKVRRRRGSPQGSGGRAGAEGRARRGPEGTRGLRPGATAAPQPGTRERPAGAGRALGELELHREDLVGSG